MALSLPRNVNFLLYFLMPHNSSLFLVVSNTFVPEEILER